LKKKYPRDYDFFMGMYANEWTAECNDCEGSGEIEYTICEESGENKDEKECDNCEGNCVEICRLCEGE